MHHCTISQTNRLGISQHWHYSSVSPWLYVEPRSSSLHIKPLPLRRQHLDRRHPRGLRLRSFCRGGKIVDRRPAQAGRSLQRCSRTGSLPSTACSARSAAHPSRHAPCPHYILHARSFSPRCKNICADVMMSRITAGGYCTLCKCVYSSGYSLFVYKLHILYSTV